MSSSALFHRLGAAVAAAMIIISAAAPAPAVAQGYSEGHKFLTAVEKRERNEVIELAGEPGSTVINARDVTSGRSAMHIVVGRRDLEWVQLLLALKANPDIADNRGVTPLMLAVQQGWLEGMQQLLVGKVRVDATNATGETPLIYAVHRRDSGMIRALLKAGANPDRADNSGRTARDYARIAGPTLLDVIESNATTSSGQSSAEVYGPR